MRALLLLLLTTIGSSAFAQARRASAPPPFGVGLYAQGAVVGISGVVDVSPRIAVQGFVGAASAGRYSATLFSGKGLYRMVLLNPIRGHLYGAAGSYSGRLRGVFRDTEVSGLYLSVGAGGEIDLKGYDWYPSGMPSISISADAGLFRWEGHTGPTLGFGAHLRF